MLAIWQKTGKQLRPVHEPVHRDDEPRSPRSLSTPAQHRIAPSRDLQPSRFKTSGR
jgi:hypothetical protein